MEQKIKNKKEKNNHSSIYLVLGVGVGGVVVFLLLDEDVLTCELQTVAPLLSRERMSDTTPLKDGNLSRAEQTHTSSIYD